VPDHGHSAKTVYLPTVNPFFLTLSLSFTLSPLSSGRAAIAPLAVRSRRRRASPSTRPARPPSPRRRSSPRRRPPPRPRPPAVAPSTPPPNAAPPNATAAPTPVAPPRSLRPLRRCPHARPAPLPPHPYAAVRTAPRRRLAQRRRGLPPRPFAVVHRPRRAPGYKLILRFLLLNIVK
jgi:hypothetical protein